MLPVGLLADPPAALAVKLTRVTVPGCVITTDQPAAEVRTLISAFIKEQANLAEFVAIGKKGDLVWVTGFALTQSTVMEFEVSPLTVATGGLGDPLA